jgi:hydroxymethylglutaryl-CoA reductase
MQEKTITGFSRLSKNEKIEWVAQHWLQHPTEAAQLLRSFWHEDEALQRVLDGFSENTLTNYYMPFGIAPNMRINDHIYAVPMVIEESSVVAAASSAAKFWLERGGFKAEVISTTKVGQVHFTWTGDYARIQQHIAALKQRLLAEATHLTENMVKRGGGILKIEWLDMTHLEPEYHQLKVTFETCDSMGANFINSVLEQFGRTLRDFVQGMTNLPEKDRDLNIIMAILSNYTPECVVRAEVQCPVDTLKGACGDLAPLAFAKKFQKAVRIAEIDPYRATTHNKGIFNGVDAVVLATGNDFRAVEACGHTHAARDGQYRSLSHCDVSDGIFRFWMELPLALGTVGGLTKLHPLAKLSLELLGNPSAAQLMEIIVSTGLAQNFAAVRSLTTTGIQKGHMKMHLQNILNHLGASDQDKERAQQHFADKTVSFTAVREFLESGATVK